MFPQNNPQQYTTSAVNQQNNQLLGNPPIQNAASSGASDPGMFNSTALQATPDVTNMIKALKGGVS
jgi:hypothetical protein